MSQSKSTSHVFGAIDIMHFADLNNKRITGLATPINQNDAANKDYVDNTVVASNLTGGVGITVNTVSNTINANPSQTQVVALGTIQTGTWTANTIQIPYGGTGQTNFTVNKLIFHNSANKLASVPEFTYDSSTINSSIPIVCSNQTDTGSELSSTGSLIVQGGTNIAKNLYVHGNTVLHSNLTVGNLHINGSLGLNAVAANNAEYFNITSGGLVVTSYFTSNSSNSLALYSTNTTLANAVIISNTTGNELITNTLSVPNLGIFGSINSSYISNGSLITFSSYTTNTSSANTTISNLRVGSAIITNLNITNTTNQNLLVPILLTAQNANIFTMTNTHGSLTNITNTNLISTNSTITNIIHTNITSNSGYINTISSGNIHGSDTLTFANATVSNIIATNLTATSTTFTNTSIGTLRVTGHANMNTINLTTITTSNIQLTNLFTSNLNNQTSTTIGTLNVSGLSIFSTTNSSSMSTGTLFSNISQNVTSSVGTLNVANNINNSAGTIITNNITSSNMYASSLMHTFNLISTNINAQSVSTDISINSTVLSSNISSGTVNISSSLTVPNFRNTNSTQTNIFITNETVSNLRVTSNTTTNTVITNSTTSNAFTLNNNSTNTTISNALISKQLVIQGSYQGTPQLTSGSFFTVLPSTFINSVTASGGNVNSWFPNYINVSTLSAVNDSITTNKVANLYIKSNVLVAGSQTVNYNSGLTLGYVSNITSGNLNTQLSFERSDGLPISGIYTENFTNKLIIMNGSLVGGSGIGINTVNNTPIVFSHIQSSTSRDQVQYARFLGTTSTFYSTEESESITSGALVINGGLGVAKNISSESIKTQTLETYGDVTTGNLQVNGNITMTNGTLTQTGYGVFSLITTSHATGTTDIDFTSGNFASGISSNVQPFTIGAGIVLDNVITFQHAGIYNVSLRLNSNTTTTAPTLIQTHINKFAGGNWQVYQTCSQKITFESNTDIVSQFMIDIQANEHIKFTINNGHSSNFTIDNNLTKSKLMINKVG
jgi:hypothetical protein